MEEARCKPLIDKGGPTKDNENESNELHNKHGCVKIVSLGIANVNKMLEVARNAAVCTREHWGRINAGDDGVG